MKKAIFPGSFDPITIGHYDIVQRALPLFDKVVISIGQNSSKRYFFSLDKRIELLRTLFKDDPKIEINAYTGLTVDYCKSEDAKYIIRGLRSSADFEYEKTIAQFNTQLNNDIETIFIISSPQYSHISSTVVREILRHGGDVTAFVPDSIETMMA